MSCFRFLRLLLPCGFLCLLPVAPAQEKPPAAAPAQPAPAAPPKPDPEAVKLLDRAISLFEPGNVVWMQTEVWQQVNVPTVTFQAQGRYMIGPDLRRRLDLKVQLGEMDGELQVVCDGTTIWQGMRTGTFPRSVSKIDLKTALETLNVAGTLPQVREQARKEFLQGQCLAGIAPLLQSLKEQMTFTKREPAKWQGRDAIVLVGVWSGDVAKVIAPPDRWPAGLPRTCRVYLDAPTTWPQRIEWWGPSPGRTEDGLLLEMEFRNPWVGTRENGLAPPKDFANFFTFTPGTDSVSDQTPAAVEALKAAAQRLTAQREASPPSTAPAPPPSR